MSTTPIFRSVRLLPKSALELDRLYGNKGEIFYDATSKSLRIFDGAIAGGTPLNVSVSVSGTPPEFPTQGSLWFNSNTGAIYLYYQDSSSNQWIAPVVSASGGGSSGASLTAFSVDTASPGTASLSYNNTSGVFTFTPPNLSSYATTASLSSYVTSSTLTSTLSGYATTSSLSSYVTSSALTSTLSGYATTSALSLAVSGVAYSLPTASNIVLGGVKVDGSTITINAGVISSPGNTRSTASVTSTALANGASGLSTIVGFKGYILYSIQTSHAAWVVLYTSSAARTADSAREETTDPLPNAGVVAEAITTGAETIVVSPAVVGFNTDSLTDIPIKITNNSGSTQSITVTLTLLKMES
jgi:hypothetical protein